MQLPKLWTPMPIVSTEALRGEHLGGSGPGDDSLSLDPVVPQEFSPTHTVTLVESGPGARFGLPEDGMPVPSLTIDQNP
jgi:hypothetical protein